MVYLKNFKLPEMIAEELFLNDIRQTCYDSFYPFGIFPQKGFSAVDFEPITIFYGSNGSGKTTLLNVIAEAIGAQRSAPYNNSSFFADFSRMCQAEWESYYQDSTIITSDDVFDYLFDLRALNHGVDTKREDLMEAYRQLRCEKFQLKSLDDYEKLKQVNSARRNTKSEFIRQNMPGNARGRSNGESAFMYFTEKIEANQIYLLDEPENSLSAAYQQELTGFIEDSARFFNCQFIIASHSPFILATKQSKIYNLDALPVTERRWTELENVRRYFEFFKSHEEELLAET